METKDKVSKINKLIRKANKLQVEENYLNAFNEWDNVVSELNALLRDTAKSRKLSKLAGWGAALATGGLGPTDFLIVPAVNKALLKWSKIDLDFIAEKLSLAIRQRQMCIYYEDKISEISIFIEEMSYFAYSYRLANKVQNSLDTVNKLFELVNPLHEEESLRFVRTELELYEEIVTILENGKISSEMRILNKSLKKYLKTKNKVNNILFEALSSYK